MNFHDILMTSAAMGGGWTPANLGASLLGWWDAEDAASLTLSGASVTTWTDKVAGYAPTQSVAGSKPTYSATSFNGRPGIAFDGTDDFFSLESMPFPSGATPCEMWALVDQTALAADNSTRVIFGYGGVASTGRRGLQRAVSGGVNIAQATVGNGTTALTANSGGDFSGIHVVRVQFGATSTVVSLDGVAGTPTASVPATDAIRTRIGTISNTTPALYFQGRGNTIMVTAPLDAEQASKTLAFLKARGGIP